ncbi:hypothetical protein CPB86DRAFT_873122 [Serendipita vermifera]|nr:hypothetical protein CPB86DRAFT_873122 [Serendipita vermifera]
MPLLGPRWTIVLPDRRNGANNFNFNQYPFPSSPFGSSFSMTSSNVATSPVSSELWNSGRDSSTTPEQTSTQEFRPAQPTQPSSTSSVIITTATFAPSTSTSSLVSTTPRTNGTTLYIMGQSLAQSASHSFPTSSRLPRSTEYISFTPFSNTSSDLAPSRSPIRLSTTAIGLLTALGATLFFFFTVCIFRCIRRQIQSRRKLKDSSFDFSNASDSVNEKNVNGSVGKSPSTIFGGKERTGLTPHPSWVTFNDGMGTTQELDRATMPSPYPLGLLPPPTMQRQPSLRGHNGLGLGVVQPSTSRVYGSHLTHVNSNYNTYASGGSQTPPSNPQFCPPTITITSSSPPSSANGPVSRTLVANESRDVSPSHSLQRVSVYDHPTYGAQLVAAPKLRVVGEEADSTTRNSGWSSWDDGVGLEMGAKLDRRHPAPKNRFKSRASKVKRGLEPMRSTLPTVVEVEDVSEVEGSTEGRVSPRKTSHEQNMRTYARSPYSSRSPSSSLRASPRALRGTSPRMAWKNSGGKDATLLYDMPRFSDSSSNVPPAVKLTSSSDESGAGPLSTPSPSPKRRSVSTRVQHQDYSSSSSAQVRRRSRRVSRPTPAQPSPTLTDVLIDAYSYVRTYAVSDDESGDQPLQRLVKRSSTSSRRAKRTSRRKSSRNPPAAGVAFTPEEPSQVHSRVGTLMLTAYGEEGGLVNGVSSPSIPRFDAKERRHEERRSSRTALADSTNEARYKYGRKISQRGYPSDQSSPFRTAVKLSQRDMYSTAPTEGTFKSDRPPTVTYPPESTYSAYIQRPVVQSQYKNDPPLPLPGQPSLHQMKLMRDMPDYRSPTYSIYGMYRDANRNSSWGNSPTHHQYAPRI